MRLFICLIPYGLCLSVRCVWQVLRSTGYLSRNEDDTFRRLWATTQMIVDCLQPPSINPDTYSGASSSSANAALRGHAFEPEHGVAWQSILRVRFLHTSVRRRLLRSKVTAHCSLLVHFLALKFPILT